MLGKAGQVQPDGQVPGGTSRGGVGSSRDLRLLWLPLALVLLAIPFNRGGLWDPYELHIAELARRLAQQLFGARGAIDGAEGLVYVTTKQLGQGELCITSPAFGFAIFGVSDWAGRSTSFFWGSVAVGSLWMLMGRLVDRIAQVISVLLLVTLPLFGWQSRAMLGDAATIGTLALSTAGLALLCFDRQLCFDRLGWSVRLLHASMAIVGLGAGLLCRGVLVGVAVPCLSVGLVSLLQGHARRSTALRRLFPALLTCLGVAAVVIGAREAWIAPKGFSFLLGAVLTGPSGSSPFDVPLTSLLHQAFPLSTLLPVACVIDLRRSRHANRAFDPEQSVALVLLFTVLLCLATMAMMARRGVAMPFPAVMSLAGISGLAVTKLHRGDTTSTLAAGFVLTVAVLLFSDFIGFPEKTLQLAGVSAPRFPESFTSESRNWLRAALAILVSGCVIVATSNSVAGARYLGASARFRRLFERIHSAYAGQLMGGFVLVETALVTTSLLQRAHEQGWITVPAFDAVRMLAGPLLKWAWLVPPFALFVAPGAYTALQIFSQWLTKPESGVIRARFSPGMTLGVTLVAAGFVMSVGHAAAMAEQVSPKRAISQYRSHARPDEPLGLLGIKPESVGYYLGAVPEAFQDIDTAANWLQSSGAKRRWLAFGSDRLAELNAAFRAASNSSNLAIVAPLASNVLVATNRLTGSERDFNPLSVDLRTQPPPAVHPSSIEFGNVIRLVDWDIRSEEGASVTTLSAGKSYELGLVFQVLGTTNVDWQVFVHVDGRGKRHNADHDPVVGRYPTTLWQPGDVVVDRHAVVLEPGASAGIHTLYMGLFRGNKRLEVTKGAHDDNRVKLGELEVR